VDCREAGGGTAGFIFGHFQPKAFIARSGKQGRRNSKFARNIRTSPVVVGAGNAQKH
jgi:hypothetical protein